MADPTDMLGLSDEDFLKLNEPNLPPPPNTDDGGAGASSEGGEAGPTEGADGGTDNQEDLENKSDTPPEKQEDNGDGNQGNEGKPSAKETESNGNTDASDAEGQSEGSKDSASGAGSEGQEGEAGTKEGNDPLGSKDEASPPDFKNLYEKVMAPFKANGKTFELKSPEEAIALMQMGAGYARKMQGMKQHRKVLTMLENNGLLDEGKLSYLIDLDKRDPEAIKKLIKDSGIDPLEIDTEAEPAYTGGNYRVTDEEANFRSVLEDIGSTSEGQETLTEINNAWDETSKQMLWQNPEILTIIQQQRDSGVYTAISTEIERQRILGKIRPETPFLEAYKTVGDQLVAASSNGPSSQGNDNLDQKHPEVLATRDAIPKKQVSNDDKARAASPTRSSTNKQAKEVINPLAMSDEEFLKLNQFEGRL
jgi:hypothetical protein